MILASCAARISAQTWLSKRPHRTTRIFYLRGKVYVATGRGADAVAAYQRAIELKPMDPRLHCQPGLLYQKLDQTELARRTLSRMEHVKQEVRTP